MTEPSVELVGTATAVVRTRARIPSTAAVRHGDRVSRSPSTGAA